MLQNTFEIYEKPTLVQVMAWCGQARSQHQNHSDPDLCSHMALLGLNELEPHFTIIHQYFQSDFSHTHYFVHLHYEVVPFFFTHM